ncbi:MAG: peptidylprolyl isomerase [Ilumatobacteraceae bacterium]
MPHPFPALDGSAPKTQQFNDVPEMGIDPSKRYTATMDTTLGTLVIALDPIKAPKTVNNFVFLALNHYYDGVIFHRIINGFMCQGGDPTGTGRGGLGQFEDELPSRVSTRSVRSPWRTPDPTPTARSSSSSAGAPASACPRCIRCSARS